METQEDPPGVIRVEVTSKQVVDPREWGPGVTYVGVQTKEQPRTLCPYCGSPTHAMAILGQPLGDLPLCRERWGQQRLHEKLEAMEEAQ